MASTRQQKPERAETDTSLGNERKKTDEEILKRSGAVERAADATLQGARGRADAVLARARSAADDKLRRAGATSAEWASLEKERLDEDEDLRDERAAADDDLSDERDAHRRALTALLASERRHTDEHLGRERELADAAVAPRDEFLAMVSHDLRDLLGGIAMSTALLLNMRGTDDPRDAVVHEAHRIQRHTARMARLIGDLVDVVSIEAGRLSLAPKRHDAMELVRETVDVFQPLAAAKGLALEFDVRGGSLLARYDYERVLQVLANLVGNALKFTPEGGRIQIVVEPDGGLVRFAVADTGPGIEADKLGVIFDRFWQSPEKKRSGLGLGLYISKCIVEAHGGKLWAESRTREGSGSTFYFTLPALAD